MKERNPRRELSQEILGIQGVTLVTQLFDNLDRVSEYKEAEKIAETSDMYKRTVAFFVDGARYTLSYNPEAIGHISLVPQKIILRKRRSDGLIEERLTFSLNETTTQGSKNKILYEKFNTRKKDPIKVEKNNAAAMLQARRLVCMQPVLDLST